MNHCQSASKYIGAGSDAQFQIMMNNIKLKKWENDGSVDGLTLQYK